MSSENYAESRHPANLVIAPGAGGSRQDRVPGTTVDTSTFSRSYGGDNAVSILGLGPEGSDASTEAEDKSASLAAVIRHLRALRTEKSILRDLGGPLEKLEQLKDETDKLETDLKQLYEGRQSTLALCLDSDTSTPEEHDRLTKLAALENKDLMMLEGVELNEAFQNIKRKLQSLEDEDGVKILMGLRTEPKVEERQFDSLKSTLKSQAMKEFRLPTDPSSDTDVRSDFNGLSEMAARFAKLDDELHELETVVGMDVVEAMSFPFQDIPTAICHLTERMLLLDPRKLEAIHERATDLSKELDKLLASKAHFVFGGELPSLQALTSEKKIETLYQLATRWKGTANSLPRLVQKLKYLSVLARDSNEVESRLDVVEREVADVKSLMESSQKSLNELNERVGEQIALMNQLVEKLEGAGKIFA